MERQGEGKREGGRAKEGKEKQELRVTQTKRDSDGETQTTVRKKERVSFRKTNTWAALHDLHFLTP